MHSAHPNKYGHRHPLAIMALLVLGGMLTPPAKAGTDPVPLVVWHSGTVFANMGMCAITLSFDSQTQTVEGLKLKLSVRDASGKVRARGEMNVPDFGQSEAQRFADGHWGNAVLCDENLQLNIDQAQARILGTPFDLIARQILEVDDFKPLPINIGKNKARKK